MMSHKNRVIVYLDERSFAKDMPRTHGYGGNGKRCYGTDDYHAKGRTHVIGAIIGFTFLRVALLEGNNNGEVFYAWLVQELLPVLPDRTVIVMDNASFHKREDRGAAIKQGGHELEYLPPYGPDLNPIEKSGHKPRRLENKTVVTWRRYLLSIWIMTNYNALAIALPDDEEVGFMVRDPTSLGTGESNRLGTVSTRLHS